MHFAQPMALWWLLLLPGVVLLLYYGSHCRTVFLRNFGDLHLLWQTPSRFPRLHREWVTALLLLVAFTCTVLALSDPRYPIGPSHLRAGTLDVVMVMDVSKSMAAEDYGSNSRLDQARQMARHMLTRLRGNRVGLVTYAGISFRQADLTDDLDALDFILEHWVSIDSVSVGGSNLSAALERRCLKPMSSVKNCCFCSPTVAPGRRRSPTRWRRRLSKISGLSSSD
jgi:Ca-activated chloride channel family protein